MPKSARQNTSPNTPARGEKGRWAPGVCPNPGGRPKAGDHVRDLARGHTDEAIETLAKIMREGKSETAQAAAANALLDRGWGRPMQPVVGDEDAPPINLKILDEAEAARRAEAARAMIDSIFGRRETDAEMTEAG